MSTSANTSERTMNRIEQTTYDTAKGPVVLGHIGADWIVSERRSGLDYGFITIGEAMAHIRNTYGWPLALHADTDI